MWTNVAIYDLPMGDIFVVQRHGKMLRGKKRTEPFSHIAYRPHSFFSAGLRRDVFTKGERVVCSTTYSMMTIKEYFYIASCADNSCLLGQNPYVSQPWAKSRKARAYAMVREKANIW